MQGVTKQTIIRNSGGGAGTPGGSDTQIQFNDGGAFGGDSRLYFDKSTGGATGGDFGAAAGASTDGAGGEIYAQGGRAGRGGDMQAFAGNAIGTDMDGGDLYFGSGSANGTGIGGRVYFQAGGSGVGGTAGNVEFQIGDADTKGKYLFRTANTNFAGELDFEPLTADRKITFQDAAGTLAYLSDITGGLKLPTYTVGATGADYTTIQGAIDVATTGGTIYVVDGTYAPFVFKYNNTRVIGNGYRSIIEADCAVTPTLVKANSTGITGCSLENFYLANTNATTQGVGLDFSNMPRNTYRNLYFYNLGTAVKADDTANQTFYNTFHEISIYECNNGIALSSTNPINDNRFYSTRISLKAGGGGKGLYMNKAQGNAFYDLNVEPGTAAGITGIHLDTVNCVNTTFTNIYAENNATGINISGAQRATFIGGMCVANTTDITDTGLDTTYIGFNKNYALYQQMVNMELVDKSNASKYATYLHNNTTYAHTGGYLALMELLNGSDTSDVLRLKNAGTGDFINALVGSTEVFSVDSAGNAYSQTNILPTYGKSYALASGVFLN